MVLSYHWLPATILNSTRLRKRPKINLSSNKSAFYTSREYRCKLASSFLVFLLFYFFIGKQGATYRFRVKWAFERKTLRLDYPLSICTVNRNKSEVTKPFPDSAYRLSLGWPLKSLPVWPISSFDLLYGVRGGNEGTFFQLNLRSLSKPPWVELDLNSCDWNCGGDICFLFGTSALLALDGVEVSFWISGILSSFVVSWTLL